MGFSIEGFEGEIVNLLLRIKNRREQGKRRGPSSTTRFNQELKKLEWSMNYNGRARESGVVKGGGVRISSCNDVKIIILECKRG